MKLAFVTPWYGPDIPGGAEAEVRRTAEHLHAAGMDVEVWTTCVRDLYADWSKNYHRPGIDRVNGVTVRRFPVGPRDRSAFDAINWKLMNNQAVTPVEEQTFMEQMLRVNGLYEHIARHADERLLLFIPYMFATTYYGVKVRPDRSYLIPCFHDEAYARLRLFRPVFEVVQGMLFFSMPEAQLAAQLFDLTHVHTQVIGAGVDLDRVGQAGAFRAKYGIRDTFLLYAGRRDPGKNIALLVEYFRRYHAARRATTQLVLIGPGAMPISVAGEPGIVDLGFVSTQDKWDAYAAAAVLCQPSLKESFSVVLMEGWAAGTPALVHAASAVTTDHCRRANGGLYFSNYEEFATCLDLLLAHPDLRTQLGRQGRDYVMQNFRWDLIVEKYRHLALTEAG